MIKIFELLTRRADMSQVDAMRYWTDVHAAMVKSKMAGDGPARRYINNIALIDNGEVAASPYDGVMEAYLALTPAQFAAGIANPANPIVADEPNFLARRPDLMRVEEKICVAPDIGAQSKLLVFLRRNQGIDKKTFNTTLEKEFVPAAIEAWGNLLAGLSLNFDCPTTWSSWGIEHSIYDAVIEFWFTCSEDQLPNELSMKEPTMGAILTKFASQRQHMRVRAVFQIDLPL